jgi:hypothetical protein
VRRCEAPEGCDAEAVIGWGPAPPVWICLAHLDAELAARRALIDAALARLAAAYTEGARVVDEALDRMGRR